ncbi:MAG TPA: MaoC family dehydratase [Pseudorhodoplanes sp.]|jgi:acyl dehydratase|nr:MaoC family dehydratase [Pseudorhodoplanes sp.]
MPKIYFEDFAPGQVRKFGPRRITREEMLAFAADFDPQPMHLDEEGGRASMLGGLAASGLFTCSIAMRMVADGILLRSSSMGANAVEEIRWLAPVRAGDALTLRLTVLDTRRSRSRPDLGFVRMLWEMFDQDGGVVMTLTAPMMFGTRSGPNS